jgi:YD repeat-containing protein
VGTVTASYQYDSNGNAVRTTDANGGVTFAYYDRLGRTVEQVDQENFVTTWSYDAEGNVLGERRHALAAAGASTAAPPVLSFQDDDRVTNFAYDRNGRRLTEQRIGVFAYGINAANGMLTLGSFATVTISYAYNGLGQVTRKTEATGEFVDYAYDAGGRLTTETRAAYQDQNGAQVRPTVDYSYDGLDHLTRTRQGGQAAAAGDRISRNAYGAGGRLETIFDANGAAYSYSYDAAGNIVRESYLRQKSDGATVNEAILYTRDILGRTVSQGVAAWTGAGWAKGDVQTVGYNAYGDVSRRGLNGLWQEQFDYDKAGHLWRTNANDGVWRYFIQDANGNQTLVLESEGMDLANKTIDQILSIATVNGAYGVGAAYVDGINASINVYDRRGLATATRLPKRQLSEAGATTDLAVSRDYNAFGEMVWEKDARGFQTNYGYNAMGRNLWISRPTVSITRENGQVENATPTEYLFYDVSGRLIGAQDANANRTTRTLLAGTGYGGTEALTASEYHADGGVIRNGYDAFGDLRKSWDELNRLTDMGYDSRGRLTQVTRASGLAEYFAYDLLGQRTRQWNSLLGAGNVATTDYDLQGRVVREVAFGGDVTTTNYAWSSALATSGMGVFGGWIQTTTYANGKTAVGQSDMFGRDLYKRDLGDHVFMFSYDLAGRLAQRSGGDAITYSFLNSGLLGSISSGFGTPGSGNDYEISRTAYAYDANGNKVSERFTKDGGHWVTPIGFDKLPPIKLPPIKLLPGTDPSPPDMPSEPTDVSTDMRIIPIDPPDPPDPVFVTYNFIYQDATATYDALGRMSNWQEAGNATTPAAQIQYDYDANGNVRRTRATYSALTAAGGTTAAAPKDHWYRYDAMNRVVTSKGSLVGGQIVRGGEGTDILYDKAGQRIRITSSTQAFARVWIENFGAPEPVSEPPEPVSEPPELFGTVDDPGGAMVPIDPGGGGHWVNIPYLAEVREEYGYDAGGYLETVRIAKSGYIDNGDGTVTVTPPPGTGELKASYSHDSIGRLTHQIDWLGNGINAAYDRMMHYNAKGQVDSETIVSKQGNDILTNNVGNDFGLGTAYALGAVVSTTSTNYKNNVFQAVSRTDNGYQWWDGAMQSTITHRPNTSQATAFTTTYFYNNRGQLNSVSVNDGRPRTISFTNNLAGQAIRRDEADNNFANGDPHESWYRFDGRQMGYTGNNGTIDTDYQTSINSRVLTPGSGAFRFGAAQGSAYADFDQNYSPINSFSQGSAGGSYTVHTGDTLSSIAAQLWGDSALWYKLAEANGMTAASGLVEGQRLTIPAGVLKSHNNASTFKPYDPAAALGDVSPTTPQPPAATVQKKNHCGIFGQILLVIIAVAVSVVTYGALTGPMAGLLGSTFGAIAAGAISGVAGSLASQAFGVATGIQDKFDWKGVAMAGIGGAVGGALQGVPFLKSGGGKFADFAKDVARGAAASAITQGIGVATGLQGKFSWAGVAAAGVGAGVAGALIRKYDIKNLKNDRSLANVGKNMLVAGASAIASAATESVIDGTDFGDNLLAALPGVIGGTIGGLIGQKLLAELKPPPKPKPVTGVRVQFQEIASLTPQISDPDLVPCQPIGPDCQPIDKFGDQEKGSYFRNIYDGVERDLQSQQKAFDRRAVDAELHRRYDHPRNGVGDAAGAGTGTGTSTGSGSSSAPAADDKPITVGTTLHTGYSLFGLNNDFLMPRRGTGSGSGPATPIDPNMPYADPTSRPSYRQWQVDSVWRNAQDAQGNVFDPNTNQLLTWDHMRSRFGQWDMGHRPGLEYNPLWQRYVSGEISKGEFLAEVQNPANYRPEAPGPNRGRMFEAPGPGPYLSNLTPRQAGISLRINGVGRAFGYAGMMYGGYQDLRSLGNELDTSYQTGNYSNTAWEAGRITTAWTGGLAGGAAGAEAGAMFGALFVPVAYITVPVFGIIGGAVGFGVGYWSGEYAVDGVHNYVDPSRLPPPPTPNGLPGPVPQPHPTPTPMP